MVEDHLGYSVVGDRTVGPSRRGPREGVIGLLHGVIGAMTRITGCRYEHGKPSVTSVACRTVENSVPCPSENE